MTFPHFHHYISEGREIVGVFQKGAREVLSFRGVLYECSACWKQFINPAGMPGVFVEVEQKTTEEVVP